MERQEGYWRRFEKTGDVMDYLNYTCLRAQNNLQLHKNICQDKLFLVLLSTQENNC